MVVSSFSVDLIEKSKNSFRANFIQPGVKKKKKKETQKLYFDFLFGSCLSYQDIVKQRHSLPGIGLVCEEWGAGGE